jgi:hypothetical protein
VRREGEEEEEEEEEEEVSGTKEDAKVKKGRRSRLAQVPDGRLRRAQPGDLTGKARDVDAGCEPIWHLRSPAGATLVRGSLADLSAPVWEGATAEKGNSAVCHCCICSCICSCICMLHVLLLCAGCCCCRAGSCKCLSRGRP